MRVISCLITEHNLWLVLLAAIVCVVGSLVTIRLLERARRTGGLQRVGWLLHTAAVAACSVWCTHFVAVLAYDPGAPVSFDPILTIASLMIAICGFGAGFAVAVGCTHRLAALLAGAMVGVAIAAMHYVGMAAYHISGIVHWEPAYVVLSVIHPVVLGIIALQLSVGIDNVIIDGFHRWHLASTRPAVTDGTGGRVPVVRLARKGSAAAAATVRHNRARGRHGVTLMGDIVRRMQADGVSD